MDISINYHIVHEHNRGLVSGVISERIAKWINSNIQKNTESFHLLITDDKDFGKGSTDDLMVSIRADTVVFVKDESKVTGPSEIIPKNIDGHLHEILQGLEHLCSH